MGFLSEDEARKTIEQAQRELEVLPDAQAYYNQATAELYLGRIEDAASHFRHALRLKPDFAAAWVNLGGALLRLGKLEEAEAANKRAIEADPDLTAGYLNLGLIHLNRGEWEEAARIYEQALSLDMLNPEAHASLGMAYLKTDNLDKAIEEGMKAIGQRPGFGAAYELVCAAYAEQGDNAAANAHCEMAEKLGYPISEGVRGRIGRA
ncbi:tetratricopeptide repeat protein [Desulfocurvibacter africanus]|uniref:Tetratricopeptide TPR_1 repeat-containing protein n=1 Tax=Desulfocurvibacter africanus subsp. africanus str. Walvis Bay TaxID=690850 RepID=F3Z0L6_DESAF|nr:tetratricopeptide repeat protein [Desulfocurvibacter africanus]EGJ49840.1 Tetratricopeptide TPR_1 repeat-containing protein [Desulfocurvibacter africanus subsp. africanus str. Walvis Bay]